MFTRRGQAVQKAPKTLASHSRYNSSYFVDFVYLMIVRLLVSHSFVKLRPLPIRVKRPEEERLAKQTADLHSLETVLLRAREIAEGRGEVVIVYFIDMAIAETRRKGPPPADHNSNPQFVKSFTKEQN